MKNVPTNIKYKVIDVVRQHKHKPYAKGTRFYMSQIMSGFGEGKWRVWDTISDYMPAYQVSYSTRTTPKWSVSLDVESPTWKELHFMNMWQQEKWIKQKDILR